MRILVIFGFTILLCALAARWVGIEFRLSAASNYHLEVPMKGPQPFHQHSIWDSGKAEFCVYSSKLSKYGIERKFETDMITIREGFNPLRMTKADDPNMDDLEPVFKMNKSRKIPTGIYSYSQTLSIFVSRTDPARMIKQAFTSADGCGMSYAEIRETNVGLKGDFYSYWEKGVHGSQEFSEKGLISYDQMVLYLRSKDLKTFKRERIRMLESVFTSYQRDLQIYDCEIIKMGEANMTVSGSLVPSHHIQLRFGSFVENMNFGILPTQPLLRWKHHDGSEEVLKSLRYLYYWELIKPGDRERIL